MTQIDVANQGFGKHGSHACGDVFDQTDKQIHELYSGMAFMQVNVRIYAKTGLKVRGVVWRQVYEQINYETD